MTTSRLPFTFSVDEATPFDTLEAVLATARRGGLTLVNIRAHATAGAVRVSIELLAQERDLLDLFAVRLRNLVDVFDMQDQDIDDANCKLSVDALYNFPTNNPEEIVSL